MNPQNLGPNQDGFFTEKDILSRVPSLFLMLGLVYMIIQLIGCLMIFKPPFYPDEIIFNEGKFLLIKSPSGEPVLDAGYNSQEEGASDHMPIQPKCIEPKEAVKSTEFIQMWLMFALSTQSVQFINTMYKAFGQQFIHDDHFLAFVGSLASVFNSGGRIIWGHWLDKSSFKVTFISLCSLLSALMLSFIITESLDSKFLYLIWVVSLFFTFSGLFVIFPTATAQLFGKTHAGTIYGILFTAPVSY